MHVHVSMTRRQIDVACDAIAERLDWVLDAIERVEDGDYQDYGPGDLQVLQSWAHDLQAVLRAMHRALGLPEEVS